LDVFRDFDGKSARQQKIAAQPLPFRIHGARLQAFWQDFLRKRYQTIARVSAPNTFPGHSGARNAQSAFSRRESRTGRALNDAKTRSVGQNPNADGVFADFPALSLQTRSWGIARRSPGLRQKMQTLAQMGKIRDNH